MALNLTTLMRSRTMGAALVVGLLSAGVGVAVGEDMKPIAQPAGTAAPAPAPAAAPEVTADTAGNPLSTDARIVIVEWKIKKGHEKEFLDYWSTKSTIPDRSGLIAEFMSSEEDHAKFPWINWVSAESNDYSTFYNVGIWRKADDFMGQIGKYIDNNRPPAAFEADHRHRVFLAPVAWRIGMSGLPAKDAAGVK